MKKSLVWLRRNIRLKDNRVIELAAQNSDKIFFCFLYDSEILSHFPDQNDRRLSFITDSLNEINNILLKYNSEIIILYGSADKEIPKLAKILQVDHIFADEDFETTSTKRDNLVRENLTYNISLVTILDHLIMHPSKIVKSDSTAFKVFTPFMKQFKLQLKEDDFRESKYELPKILSDIDYQLLENNAYFLSKLSKNQILEKIGYIYREDDLWRAIDCKKRFEDFLHRKIFDYKNARDMLDQNSTSAISPYLRFGLISPRECLRKILSLVNDNSNLFLLENIEQDKGVQCWFNELIWREFYAYILFHFPKSANEEFQEKYIGTIEWRNSEDDFQKFCSAKTGFPIIDAAINELITTGWMHNRARMITASFLTKNLLIDWRKGEQFFAKYLMDYDLASNVGGWQWSASTGTDAQPYFRIFNPILQSKKFDPNGKYIRKYLPELSSVNSEHIHDGELIYRNYNILSYPKPMVDFSLSRKIALEVFSKIKK